MEFLDSQGILSDKQLDSAKGRSTEDLAKAINDWALSKDKGRHTAVAFIDLSKALERVHHQALLLTLQRCGVGGLALQWFGDYLSNRYK